MAANERTKWSRDQSHYGRAHKKCRIEWCKKALKFLQHDPDYFRKILFNDDGMFYLGEVVEVEMWLNVSLGKLNNLDPTHKKSRIMVFGVICQEGSAFLVTVKGHMTTRLHGDLLDEIQNLCRTIPQ